MKSKSPPLQGTSVDLLHLSNQLGSVTRAGRVLGFGWNNSPRLRGDGEQAATVVEHVLPNSVEAAIVSISLEQPSWGPVRLSNELLRRGVDVTRTEIMHVWQLHDLKARDKRKQALIKSQATLRALAPEAPKRKPRFQFLALIERLVLLSLLVGFTLALLTLYTMFF